MTTTDSVARSRGLLSRPAKLIIGAALAIAASTAVSVSASADWDYTYGDAGPLDYSEFLEVATTPDGGAFIFGVHSGNFEGLDAGLSYRPFAQYRDLDGTEQWTVDLGRGDSCADSTTLQSEMVVDGLGIAYIYFSWCNQSDLVAVDASGVLARQEGVFIDTNKRDLTPVLLGGVQVVAGNNVIRFNKALEEQWNVPIPLELEGPRGDNMAWGAPVTRSVVAVDGTGWIVGWIPRPLPQLEDAVGLFKVSADGTSTTTVKHYGQDCDGALKATEDQIWLRCNPRELDAVTIWLYEILAFDAGDGRLVGEVTYPGLEVPFVDESGMEDAPALTSLGAAMGAGSIRFSTDGSFAFGNNGPPFFKNFVWRVTGTLDEAVWEEVGSTDLAGRTVRDSDSSGDAAVVLVGSTAEGSSQTATGPPKAFVTQRPLAGMVSISPSRLLDTRSGNQTVDGESAGIGRRAAGQVTRLQVAGRAQIPRDAKAAFINVTAIRPSQGGYITVFPCNVKQPNASTLNYAAGQVVANGATIELSPSGEVCIYTRRAMDLAVDVTAYFPTWSAFTGLAPGRLFESRSGLATVDGQQNAQGRRTAGQVTRVQIADRSGVPGDALAAVVNVTAIRPSQGGYITVFPCDEKQPNASTLNYTTGQVVANGATTKLGPKGDICVFNNRATDLVVDVTGYHPAGSSFDGVTPARVFESRSGLATVDGKQNAAGRLSGGEQVQVRIAGRGGVPGDASAVAVNVTAIRPVQNGYITVWPCNEPRPNASTLNYAAGQVVANGATIKLDPQGDICVYANRETDLVVDVTGYFAG